MNDSEPWIFLPKQEPFADTPPETTREVVHWWERRRLGYSLYIMLLVVLVRGIGAVHHLVHVRQSGELSEWSLGFLISVFYAILCLVLANICYTLAWMAELVVRKLFGGRVHRFGPVALVVLFVAPALLFSTTVGAAVMHIASHHMPRH